MHVEIHDRDGRVQIEDLIDEGVREARYQCEQLINALDERERELAEAEDEDED